MHHYEIVFIVHPDLSDQVPNMITDYVAIVNNSGGKVHRLEDWGRRPLAYPINKLHKAHYVLINIEVQSNIIDELKKSFRFNDNIIRNMIIKVKNAITQPSPIIKSKEEKRDKREDFSNNEYSNNAFNA